MIQGPITVSLDKSSNKSHVRGRVMTPRAIPRLNYVFLATLSRTRSHFRSGSSNCERFPVKERSNIALFPELLQDINKTVPFVGGSAERVRGMINLCVCMIYPVRARHNLMFPHPSPGLPFNVSGGNQPADSLMKANMMIRGVACVSLVAYTN